MSRIQQMIEKAHSYANQKNAECSAKAQLGKTGIEWVIVTRTDGRFVILALPSREQTQTAIDALRFWGCKFVLFGT